MCSGAWVGFMGKVPWGASWGWPYKAQDKNPKIDANRSAVFCYGFKKKKQKQCH